VWSSFTLHSPDPPVALRERLATALTGNRPPFRGQATGDGYELLLPWHPFLGLPLVVANVELAPDSGDGTTVRVRTRPRVLLLAILVSGAFAWLWALLIAPGGKADWFRPWLAVAGFLLVGLTAFIHATIQERMYRNRLNQLLKPER
jgi:hypothetical protein